MARMSARFRNGLWFLVLSALIIPYNVWLVSEVFGIQSQVALVEAQVRRVDENCDRLESSRDRLETLLDVAYIRGTLERKQR